MRILVTITAVLLTVGHLPATIRADTPEVPRIQNLEMPPGGIERLELEELWRVGGEDGEVIFGVVADVIADPDGIVYVLDNQLCQVAVLSPDGELLRTLSREGDGPGEIRQPVDLVLLPDDTLGIVMGFPGKIVCVALDGTPGATLYPAGDPKDGGFGMLRGVERQGDRLISCCASVEFAEGGAGTMHRFMAVSDLDCTESTHFLDKSTPLLNSSRKYVESNEYYVTEGWDVAPDGRIYAAAHRDRYEIWVHDAAGQLTSIIERPYEARKRTQDEKDAVGSNIRIVRHGEELQFDRDIEDYDECISRLFVDEAGHIWVLTPHGDKEQPDDLLQTWDVFDADGRFEKQVAIPLGHEMEHGEIYLIGGDRMIVVKGTDSENTTADAAEDAEGEPLEVICYRIG